MRGISLFFASIMTLFSGVFGIHSQQVIQRQTQYSVQQTNNSVSINPTELQTQTSGQQQIVTDAQLLAMAGNIYANGNLPLGDNKYVTDAPKKGYIYLCNVHKEASGAQYYGSWIHGTTWNYLEKITVGGNVSWPNATFSNIITGTIRTLSGNGLPLDHTTGIFPIRSTDPAYTYDHNPNTISPQSFQEQVSVNPMYSDTPYCMGGEVGVMLSGVPLFDGFDAGLRDAAGHELQDSCDGHPQNSGEYHYHSLSRCFKDINEKTVLGYALDGFPITGPEVAKGKYLTTQNLDECHGITSAILVNGKETVIYHYVMTQDFPYSASCFRSKPAQPSGIGSPIGNSSNRQPQQMPQQNTMQNPPGPGNVQPPQEALNACSGKTTGSGCMFTSPRGDTITGTCQNPPNSSLACVPNR